MGKVERQFDLRATFPCSNTGAEDKEGLHTLGVHLLALHASADVSVMTTRPDRRNVFLAEMSFLTADFPASDSLLCIPHFADAWSLHRPTAEYEAFFAELRDAHSTFFGAEAELDTLLRTVEVRAFTPPSQLPSTPPPPTERIQ